jgi:hypothetical protein
VAECNCGEDERDVVCPECELLGATHLTHCMNAAHRHCPVWEGGGPGGG